MAQIVTITNPLTGQPAQVDQLEHTAQQIDDSIGRALPGGEIDTLLAGKAPAGYGIGEENAARVNDTDLDTLKKGGTYYIGTGCTNTPPNTDSSWSTLHVIPGRACTQIFIPANDANRAGTFSSWIARIYNDKTAAWGEWEWVNPPMAAGVEYRTTERYLGKPVYTKLVDCGVGPNATKKRVSAGISNVDRAVSANGSWGNMSIPYEWFSGDASGAQAITITLNDTYIDIASTVNYSGRTIYALIKYTKTTD